MKLFLIGAVCFGLVYGRIPAGVFPKCSRNDQEITQCLLNGVEAVRPLLLEGIPGIGFPSLEPFTMDFIALDATIPGLKLRGDAKNIEATGAGDFKITNFNVDLRKSTAEATLIIPKLEVTANYDVRGTKVLFVTVTTTGKFKGTFRNVKAVVKGRGKLDSKNGLDYVKVSHLTIDIDIGKGSSVHVTPDNQRSTSMVAAKMINMAPPNLLLKMLKTSINTAAATIVKKYVNKVLSELPLQDVLE